MHKKWPSENERTEMGPNKPSTDCYLNISKVSELNNLSILLSVCVGIKGVT